MFSLFGYEESKILLSLLDLFFIKIIVYHKFIVDSFSQDSYNHEEY